MISILEYLLGAPLSGEPVLSLSDHSARVGELRFPSTVDRASAAGLLADRLGYAFAGGYRAALARLVPGVEGHACLCATEQGGGHPRAIRTALTPVEGGARLDGAKTWVTLGSSAEELLVVASVGIDAEGKNRLKLVRLPAAREGIALRDRAPAPFAPEIAHAEATFSGVFVSAEEILEGDGYDMYLKPFRTIEDIHVLASALGYAVSAARRGRWPEEWIEGALSALLSLREIGAADPTRPEVHIALAGALGLVTRLLAESEPHWAKLGEDERARWLRDRPLLEVAGKARALRRQAAWRGRSLLTSP